MTNKVMEISKKLLTGVSAVALIAGGAIGFGVNLNDGYSNGFEAGLEEGRAEIIEPVVDVVEEEVVEEVVEEVEDFVEVNGAQYTSEDVNALLAVAEMAEDTTTIEELFETAKERARSKFSKIDKPGTYEFELDEFEVVDWNDGKTSIDVTDWEDGDYKVTFDKVELEYDDNDDEDDEAEYKIEVTYEKGQTPEVEFTKL